jgi:hypothetical protein
MLRQPSAEALILQAEGRQCLAKLKYEWQNSHMEPEPETSFAAILTEDVARALSRQEAQDTQSTRRDLVRSAFAAIEGWVWLFREEVREAANQTIGLTEEERAVLSENTLFVAQNGEIKSRPNYLDLKTTIRLCAKVANRLTGKDDIDFSELGWSKLQEAKNIRNRITHPKSAKELCITQHDVEKVLDAFYWISENILDALASSIEARLDYLGGIKEVFEGLKMNDPEISSLYQALTTEPSDF